MSRKELAAVSMRKKRKPFLTDANRTKTTPIPDLEELPGAKVGKEAETANRIWKNEIVNAEKRTSKSLVGRMLCGRGAKKIPALRMKMWRRIRTYRSIIISYAA